MCKKWKCYASLALWICVYLLAGYFIGEMTRAQIPSWYSTLHKSPLNPPDFLFGIVWTILYVAIAITGWHLWNKRDLPQGKMIFCVFILQTFMNWAWSYFFFSFHLLGFSLAWLLGLVVVVTILIFHLRRFDRISFWMLLPYLAWISFASYLNASIWFLN